MGGGMLYRVVVAGSGGLEMITINKGPAGVITDFIRQQEMEPVGGGFLCSGNLYGSYGELRSRPPLAASANPGVLFFICLLPKRKMFPGFVDLLEEKRIFF